MATFYSPKIVTDGLVLAFDAGNRKSYPGSGTIWNDLTGTSLTGSLLYGPTFDNSNAGNIVFDGNDDTVSFYCPNLSSVATVELWAKLNNNYSNKMIMGWLRYSVWCSGGGLGYNTSAGDLYGITSASASSLGILNNWKHYVFEMRSDISYTNNKIYVNTVPQSLSQIQGGGDNQDNRNFNTGSGQISGWLRDASGYRIPMNCGSFKIYNRILSSTEIENNFNATRGRFGV